jgi:hypothetical protein
MGGPRLFRACVCSPRLFGRIAFAHSDLSGAMDHRNAFIESNRAVRQFLRPGGGLGGCRTSAGLLRKLPVRGDEIVVQFGLARHFVRHERNSPER